MKLQQITKKRWFRALSCSLVLSLIASDLSAYATVVFPTEISPSFSLSAVGIPSELGSIQETFQGKSRALVIHIQDAHASVSAQESLARLVKYVHETYGVKDVLVEGGEGELPMNEARTFPDEAIRKKVAHEFLESRQITGPEYYAISENPPVRFFGIEKLAAYYQNREQFLSAERIGKAEAERLKRFRVALRNLEARKFNPALRTFTARARRLKENETFHSSLFSSHLHYLLKTYTEVISPAPEAFARDYPALHSLTVQEEGHRMDVVHQQNIIKEFEALHRRIEKALTKSEEERRLRELLTFADWIAGLLHLSITRSDYEAFRAVRERVSAGYAKEVFTALGAENAWQNDFSKLFESLVPATAFYEGALARDDIFIKQAKKELDQSPEHRAVLISGGFHTRGITERLRQRNISYVVIQPAISDYRPSDLKEYRSARVPGESVTSTIPLEVGFGTMRDVGASERRNAFYRRAALLLIDRYVSESHEIASTASSSGFGAEEESKDARLEHAMDRVLANLTGKEKHTGFKLSSGRDVGQLGIQQALSFLIVDQDVSSGMDYESLNNAKSHIKKASELLARQGKFASKEYDSTEKRYLEARRLIEDAQFELGSALHNAYLRWGELAVSEFPKPDIDKEETEGLQFAGSEEADRVWLDTGYKEEETAPFGSPKLQALDRIRLDFDAVQNYFDSAILSVLNTGHTKSELLQEFIVPALIDVSRSSIRPEKADEKPDAESGSRMIITSVSDTGLETTKEFIMPAYTPPPSIRPEMAAEDTYYTRLEGADSGDDFQARAIEAIAQKLNAAGIFLPKDFKEESLKDKDIHTTLFSITHYASLLPPRAGFGAEEESRDARLERAMERALANLNGTEKREGFKLSSGEDVGQLGVRQALYSLIVNEDLERDKKDFEAINRAISYFNQMAEVLGRKGEFASEEYRSAEARYRKIHDLLWSAESELLNMRSGLLLAPLMFSEMSESQLVGKLGITEHVSLKDFGRDFRIVFDYFSDTVVSVFRTGRTRLELKKEFIVPALNKAVKRTLRLGMFKENTTYADLGLDESERKTEVIDEIINRLRAADIFIRIGFRSKTETNKNLSDTLFTIVGHSSLLPPQAGFGAEEETSDARLTHAMDRVLTPQGFGVRGKAEHGSFNPFHVTLVRSNINTGLLDVVAQEEAGRGRGSSKQEGAAQRMIDVLRMRFLDRLGQVEMARRLSTTQSNVLETIHRGLARLWELAAERNGDVTNEELVRRYAFMLDRLTTEKNATILRGRFIDGLLQEEMLSQIGLKPSQGQKIYRHITAGLVSLREFHEAMKTAPADLILAADRKNYVSRFRPAFESIFSGAHRSFLSPALSVIYEEKTLSEAAKDAGVSEEDLELKINRAFQILWNGNEPSDPKGLAERYRFLWPLLNADQREPLISTKPIGKIPSQIVRESMSRLFNWMGPLSDRELIVSFPSEVDRLGVDQAHILRGHAIDRRGFSDLARKRHGRSSEKLSGLVRHRYFKNLYDLRERVSRFTSLDEIEESAAGFGAEEEREKRHILFSTMTSAADYLTGRSDRKGYPILDGDDDSDVAKMGDQSALIRIEQTYISDPLGKARPPILHVRNALQNAENVLTKDYGSSKVSFEQVRLAYENALNELDASARSLEEFDALIGTELKKEMAPEWWSDEYGFRPDADVVGFRNDIRQVARHVREDVICVLRTGLEKRRLFHLFTQAAAGAVGEHPDRIEETSYYDQFYHHRMGVNFKEKMAHAIRSAFLEKSIATPNTFDRRIHEHQTFGETFVWLMRNSTRTAAQGFGVRRKTEHPALHPLHITLVKNNPDLLAVMEKEKKGRQRRQVEILRMRFLDELGQAEIASRLDTTQPDVTDMIHRGLARLWEMVAERNGDLSNIELVRRYAFVLDRVLTQKNADVLRGRFIEGLSLAQIISRIGLPASQNTKIYSRTAYGLTALREFHEAMKSAPVDLILPADRKNYVARFEQAFEALFSGTYSRFFPAALSVIRGEKSMADAAKEIGISEDDLELKVNRALQILWNESERYHKSGLADEYSFLGPLLGGQERVALASYASSGEDPSYRPRLAMSKLFNLMSPLSDRELILSFSSEVDGLGVREARILRAHAVDGKEFPEILKEVGGGGGTGALASMRYEYFNNLYLLRERVSRFTSLDEIEQFNAAAGFGATDPWQGGAPTPSYVNELLSEASDFLHQGELGKAEERINRAFGALGRLAPRDASELAKMLFDLHHRLAVAYWAIDKGKQKVVIDLLRRAYGILKTYQIYLSPDAFRDFMLFLNEVSPNPPRPGAFSAVPKIEKVEESAPELLLKEIRSASLYRLDDIERNEIPTFSAQDQAMLTKAVAERREVLELQTQDVVLARSRKIRKGEKENVPQPQPRNKKSSTKPEGRSNKDLAESALQGNGNDLNKLRARVNRGDQDAGRELERVEKELERRARKEDAGFGRMATPTPSTFEDSVAETGSTILITARHREAVRGLVNMPERLRQRIFNGFKNIVIVWEGDKVRAEEIGYELAGRLRTHGRGINVVGLGSAAELREDAVRRLLKDDLFYFGNGNDLPPEIQFLLSPEHTQMAELITWMGRVADAERAVRVAA